MLAQAITKSADVVLAASGMKQISEDSATTRIDVDRLSLSGAPKSVATRWPAMSMPAPPLLAALEKPGSLGFISTPLDSDGRLRRFPLVQQVDTRVLPSLPVAGLLIGTDETARAFSHTRHEVRVAEHRWPVDAEGTAYMVLPTNADAVRTLSFASVMGVALGADDDPKVRTALAGRTVYVGSSAFLGDDVITPLGPRSGTALLAMVQGALARDQVLEPVSTPVQALLIVVALLPCAVMWRRGRPALSGDSVAALATGVAIVAIGLLLLTRSRQWIDLATPLSVVVFGLVLSAATQWRWTMSANRRLIHEHAVANAANQAKSDFLASVSHEIRTPLNAVLGMAEVLSRTNLSAEQRRYVDVFRSSGATLCNLINDLLDLSKIEASKLELERSVFALDDLLSEQMTMLAPLAEARQLALSWRIDDGVAPRVKGDRQRLAQAIVNLVGNAIKFTQQGSVSIEVHRETSGLLRFDVKDTGIGIASSKFELIFQPFTQADGSVTRSYGGTGLGLSITKSLVELMGGHIRVESRPGLGSTFSFTIDAPSVPDATESASAESMMPTPVESAASPSLMDLANGPQVDDAPALPILLVDDNEVNLIVTEALLRDTGWTVELARSGEAAISKISRGRYSLVMMDVQMPGMDGLAATREIRRIEADEGRARTPVVALTANAFESDERRSLDAGCDAHVTKPLSRQRLLDVVRTHGRRFEAPAAPPVPMTRSQLSSDEMDVEAALTALGGDRVLYQRLLDHAKVFMGTWNQEFAHALNAGDANSALRLAHDLKTIAASVGMQSLAEVAVLLDSALRFSDVEGVQRARILVTERMRKALIYTLSMGESRSLEDLKHDR